MRQNFYEQTFALKNWQTDIQACWKPSSLLIAMQEIATEHAQQLGGGYDRLGPKGLCWVLMKTHVEMLRYPRVGDTIRLVSYPGRTRHMVYPRFFRFEGEDGAPVGRAATAWAIIRTQDRRMVQPDEAGFVTEEGGDGGENLPQAKSFRPIEGAVTECDYRPAYSDFDFNGHVNNTRYVDWLCDLLYGGAVPDSEIAELSLHYHAELRPQSQVRLILTRGESAATLVGESGEETAFTLSAQLRPRR